MNQCPHCGSPLSEPKLFDSSTPSTQTTLFCGVCGKIIHEPPPAPHLRAETGGFTIIRSYFVTVWKILRQPTAFFRELPLTGGVNRPLAFILVSHWLGKTLDFLWAPPLHSDNMKRFSQLVMRVDSDLVDLSRLTQNDLGSGMDRLREWFTQVSGIVVDPFKTIVMVIIMSAFVFIGARLVVNPGKDGAPKEITYESALRLVSYGMTPCILMAVPFVGGFFYAIGTLIVMTIGAREIYRVDNFRGFVIAFFPYILFFGGIFALAFIAFTFAAALMGMLFTLMV